MKVFKSEKAKRKIMETYNQLLDLWKVEYQERDIQSRYGTTHIIECGDKQKPPLLLFHGVGDNSALMWVYNAKEIAPYFHIFAIDTIGGPGKSCPNENYNKDFDEIKWIDDLYMNLSIEKAYIAGVSNGSYMAHHYGIIRPQKVIKMVCMAGSVSTIGNSHPMKTMIKVFLPEALFPTKRNVEKLIQKLSGENSRAFTDNTVIMEHFSALLKGFNNMAMAYHKVEFFDEKQIKNLCNKCLFLIGEADPMGDIAKVKEKLDRYNLEYQTYKNVGHGINHEIANVINKKIIEYFMSSSNFIAS